MVSIGTLFAFLVVAIAVIVLRRTKPKMERPFRTPSVPWLPIASAVTCVALMASLAVETWLRFLVWLVSVWSSTSSTAAHTRGSLPAVGRGGRRGARRGEGRLIPATPRDARTDVCTRLGRVLKMQLALSLRE